MPGKNYGDGCSYPGCPNPVTGGQGLCGKHWERLKRYGDPGHMERAESDKLARCTHEDGCDRPVCAKGLCRMHYQRARREELREMWGVSARPYRAGRRSKRRYDLQWNIWLTEDLATKVLEAAEKLGIHRNEVIRQALRETLRTGKGEKAS